MYMHKHTKTQTSTKDTFARLAVQPAKSTNDRQMDAPKAKKKRNNVDVCDFVARAKCRWMMDRHPSDP